MSIFHTGFLLSFSVTAQLIFGMAYAYAADRSLSCANIGDDLERLRCYDSQVKQQEKGELAADNDSEDSAVAQRIRSEQENTTRSFVILPHRRNYILPYTYNSSPNQVLNASSEPDAELDEEEVKYQISFKIPIDDDFLFDRTSLWFSYTQLAFWQAYNSEISAPFRETNFEPEIWVAYEWNREFFGLNTRYFIVGFSHQSNGRSAPLSRSWNRVYANFILEEGNLALSFKPWIRIEENDDDNPDIEKFMGHAELHAFYKWDRHGLGLTLRNNFRSDNKGAVQLVNLPR